MSPALQQFVQEQQQKAQVTELTSNIVSVRLQQCRVCYKRALLTGSFLRHCLTCALSAVALTSCVVVTANKGRSTLQVCWDKCMGTPGRSLSSREQACLSECARRYLDTSQVPHTWAMLIASSFKRVCLPIPDMARFLASYRHADFQVGCARSSLPKGLHKKAPAPAAGFKRQALGMGICPAPDFATRE